MLFTDYTFFIFACRIMALYRSFSFCVFFLP